MNALNRLLAAALTLAATGTALAQATISHDKALAGSVTPGDAAGYPVTISQPGSYKLMSNLVVPAGSDGIVITASDVSLDLNGFRIVGSGTCAYFYHAVSCQNTTGIGIKGTGARGLSIEAGSVIGFMQGIAIDDGRVTAVNLRHNLFGLSIGYSTDVNDSGVVLISGLRALMNKAGIASSNPGFYFPPATMIERSVFSMNETAIVGSQDTAVNESTVTSNGTGIYTGNVRASLVTRNGKNTINTSAY